MLTILASVILSFAEPNDVEAVRHFLHNAHGASKKKFVLVEVPKALYAGFYWTLQQLQRQSYSDEDLAFVSSIAPSVPGISPQVSPPEYAVDNDFAFQLDCLRKNGCTDGQPPLILRPSELASDEKQLGRLMGIICQETTLDRGQAVALCENLCRGFAFTQVHYFSQLSVFNMTKDKAQGPPGTGKTYVLTKLGFWYLK